MGSYKNLIAWQKGVELSQAVYQLTAKFPSDERFGLVNQMRRCSVSIPSNIAEGYGRGSDNETVHFLYVSLGSSNELDTQLTISQRLSFISDEDYEEITCLNNEVNKMIASLIYRKKNGLDRNSRQ